MATHAGVKFVDLHAQYQPEEESILKAITDIVRKGAFVGGEALREFETHLAAYCGTRFAVGCSDGTIALIIALRCAGLRKGQGVVVPTNSFIASANAVVHAGGVPVLVDVDPATFLMDLNQAEDALRRGKASFLLPVHLYGNPCPMPEVIALAERYDAVVIEDNAQAIGASVAGRKTGGFGAAAGLSFYPSKNLGGFGQGGALLTNEKAIADAARTYVEQGQSSRKYYHEVVGYNGRLDAIQAVVLNHLLAKVDAFNHRRLAAADAYARRLDPSRVQVRTAGSAPVYHLFEYRCADESHRDRLANAFEAEGIQYAYHYPVPIHKQVAYKENNDLSLPTAERLAATLISLPMHPCLSDADIALVCDVIGATTA
jgi:dTDP-4-amino-4,6-dideoxygalactose transaminase